QAGPAAGVIHRPDAEADHPGEHRGGPPVDEQEAHAVLEGDFPHPAFEGLGGGRRDGRGDGAGQEERGGEQGGERRSPRGVHGSTLTVTPWRIWIDASISISFTTSHTHPTSAAMLPACWRAT